MFDLETANHLEPIAGSVDEFFAPTPHTLIDGLLGQYNAMRARVEQAAAAVHGELAGALHYFLEGNAERGRYAVPNVAELFDVGGAIGALNADFWKRALALTDVYDCMPQQRRAEWDESIREHKTPDFDDATVAATIADLLAARERFMAERVDGLFRALSGHHVTNQPQGFGARMIVQYAFSYGMPSTDRSGYLHDLRCVIARFMDREAPPWNASSDALSAAMRNSGTWHMLDGGTLRLRVYKIGTMHLEVHPDMAWRLNAILHTLHPYAIPASFRTKQAKPRKAFAVIQRPIPYRVLTVLAEMRRHKRARDRYEIPYNAGKELCAEIRAVLHSIGGADVPDNPRAVAFDFDAGDVVDLIITSGCLPDQRTHQFYPTPETVAVAVIDRADIDGAESILEPSAGCGALADLLPRDRTTCVELSELHCKVLESKGHHVVNADFLAWAASTPKRFARVVMNPPFSEGRALLHLQAAARLTAPGGRIVAVLPATYRGRALLEGFAGEWSEVYVNEFDGTGAAVAIYTATRES